ncbi:uncharacterized protein G2W53_009291 [Senna tora]|uniref:Uncharacterized protein n=1 Tax=Senna tora TaxID=362788 RepID=A0A834WYB8_9FABA|nr:uncharacterized protein G2W53_009291 [Senna tora]
MIGSVAALLLVCMRNQPAKDKLVPRDFDANNEQDISKDNSHLHQFITNELLLLQKMLQLRTHKLSPRVLKLKLFQFQPSP